MKRRQFLRNTSLLTAGGLIVPSWTLSACHQDDSLRFDGKVIVIGAGAAGLYAGWLMQRNGIAYELLEASSRYGGRLGPLDDFADYPLDLGAEWLHGKKNLIGDLVRDTGTAITKDRSPETYWFQQQLTASLPRDPYIFEQSGLPDVSFWDYAVQQGFGDEYRYIIESLAGDQGADATALSAYWNNWEERNWSSGNGDYKFRESYYAFYDRYIAAGVKDNIRLNTAIKEIDCSGSEVVVTDTEDRLYFADKVILTVPVSILQEGSIRFIPALSSEKTEAIAKIGMGPGMKVFLKFTQPFYDPFIIGGTTCAAYADESVGKVGSDAVLMAFLMGHQAAAMTALGSEEAIVDALLTELDGMYGGAASANFLDAYVVDWSAAPFIRGAYSFSALGIGGARAAAAEPVANKLFFAGEALNLNGHHQTVFGAAESARSALEALVAGAR